MSSPKRKFGELAVNAGLCTAEQVSSAIRQQEREGGARSLGDILIENRALKEKDVAIILGIQFSIDHMPDDVRQAVHAVRYQDEDSDVLKRRLADPSNLWGLVLRLGERWGFPTMVAAASMWFVWQLFVTNREDLSGRDRTQYEVQSQFLKSLDRNTTAIESMAHQQEESTRILRSIDGSLTGGRRVR